MKKIVIKYLNILLIISILLNPINTYAITINNSIKNNPQKGDIYNPQNNTVSSTKTTITATNGIVDIEKRIKKVNDEGQYNISFWIKGDKTINAVAKDTYIVFVIDRSFTMGSNNRWTNAKDAVISISSQLSQIPKVKMALVGFSGGKSSKSKPWDDTVTLRSTFSSSAFSKTEFGNYDTDQTYNGGTNIQGGLLKAKELLNGKNGNKYVILLSDGVPTFYYDTNGNTLGTGNSNTAEKISGVPSCKDAAISVATEMKKDTTIYSIGYDLNNLTNEFTYNGTYYNEKTLAIETLTGIATPGKYLTASTNSNNTIASELQKVETEITTYYAGSNPSITDGIGTNFKLDNTNNYGGNKHLNTNKDFIIEDTFKEIDNFNINIDTTVDTNWYPTNNSFTLTYTSADGTKKTITSNKNPEVYWKNKYPYTVNYYKDSITNPNDISHFINSYSNNIDNKTNINNSDIDLLKYIPEGYYLDGMYNTDGTTKIDSLTVEKNKENIINILYKIKKFDYKINYYYADTNNKYTIPETTKTIKDVEYGTKVITSNHYLKDNEIKEGYSLDENTTKNITHTIKDNQVIINIYYKRNIHKYRVNYYFNGKYDNSFDYTANAQYGSSIFASNHYLENINSVGLANKNQLDNTNYFLEPSNLSNTSSIIIGTNQLLNILNIYYVDTKIISEDINKDADIEKITNNNTSITYTVNYNSTINNIKKDDNITITIVDKLPFKIDEENSNLNGGTYNEEDLTITWIYKEKANNFTKIYNISKEISYKVLYKDFSNISSSNDNQLINTVTGTTKVTNLSSPGITDTDNIEVAINGKIIVHYITKDNQKLTDSIEITGLVGSDYQTTKKKFDKYSFIKLKGNKTGKITEGTTEVYYIYDKTPLPPKTGVEKNNLYITYIISLIGIFIIKYNFKNQTN